MAEITLLGETELRACVPLDAACIDCVERCFATLAGGEVVMPPILHLAIGERRGEVDVKSAWLPGLASFAIKVSSGFFDNPRLGLPSLSGLMVVLSATTGRPEALLLDNGYLTDLRTAAAGAVAARWLAREDAASAAILGAGTQARLQLEALTRVRPIRSARLWARDPERARECAAALSASLGLAVGAAGSVREAVAGADVVVTTTPSREPLLSADMLAPGQHVTAVGADAPYKNELAPDVLRAGYYVCDRLAQVRELGELHHAIVQAACGAEEAFPELGQVVAGQAPGRTGEAQITVCDLTGTGAQDTAIAAFARERAGAAGLGSVLTI